MAAERRRGAAVDPTRAAIVRLGAEAEEELARLPDTPRLRAADRAFVAAHPLAAGSLGGPIVRRMRRLIERYRKECGIDRLHAQLAFAEAYRRVVAREAGSDSAGDASASCNPGANPA